MSESREDLREFAATSTGIELLDAARSLGVLSALDQQFASRLSRLFSEERAGPCWALAIASRQENLGHVCADLRRLAETGLSIETKTGPAIFSALATSDSVEDWIDELQTSPLIAVVSEADREGAKGRPLILDDRGRLYLRRSYRSEESLAELIRVRTRAPDLQVDSEVASASIRRLLPASVDEDSASRLALETALSRPLSIVTGGPGTGKTTMVARLVALLIEQALECGDPIPRIRLLAPTGKAAAAMSAAFSFQRNALDLAPALRDAMDFSAETVHRALYPQSRRDALGRGSGWSFEDELVVVDEASMVDLELMTRLFEACRSVRRVVLLGDPLQLASVDSGAVLSELCEPATRAGDSVRSSDEVGEIGADTGGADGDVQTDRGPRDSIVQLRKSHRFEEAGGIGRLAEAIRSGDGSAVIDILQDPSHAEVELCPIESVAETRERLVLLSRPLQQEIGDASTMSDKLERLGLYRVLCAHRRGPLGAETLCSILDQVTAAGRPPIARSDWWVGRMLLVTQNAPEQNLWNGDVGLIEETPSGLRAVFPDGDGGFRALSEGRLPAHESAIAMSVHKSQGSEFEVVDLVLGDVMSRVMTRELVYTGVTRARSKLRIHASESVLKDAIGRRVSRDSGLGERVWAH